MSFHKFLGRVWMPFCRLAGVVQPFLFVCWENETQTHRKDLAEFRGIESGMGEITNKSNKQPGHGFWFNNWVVLSILLLSLHALRRHNLYLFWNVFKCLLICYPFSLALPASRCQGNQVSGLPGCRAGAKRFNRTTHRTHLTESVLF